MFIDMDGLAHFATPAPPTAATGPDPDPTPEPPDEPALEASEAEPAEVAMDFSFSSAIEESGDFHPASAPAPVELFAAPNVETSDEPFDMDQLLGYAPSEEKVPVSETAEIGGPGDPLGLNAFANSEVSQAKDGLLSFSILISGIDSKELRESLRQALEDGRFGWNAGILMGRIRKGCLRLDNVSPVKATILVNRIKRLPLTISWEQYAITQMEGESNEASDFSHSGEPLGDGDS